MIAICMSVCCFKIRIPISQYDICLITTNDDKIIGHSKVGQNHSRDAAALETGVNNVTEQLNL